jgi:DNA repair protein RecO (recombination protein O)
LLEPFALVSIQFSGKLGIKNLTHAHWIQALNPLHPAHAMQGWYLSELCLRALGEDDPQPSVFAAYDTAVKALIALPESEDTQTILRQFEVQLLIALGLWPDDRQDAAGHPLQADAAYTLDEGNGWTFCPTHDADKHAWSLLGTQIHSLAGKANAAFAKDKLSLQTVRIALRALLSPALHGKVLSTREVWKELDAIATKP